MIFEDKRTNERYLINLIDTPGHIDFSYEVARSLASCQGALLLVDSTQSVQAQTLANHGKAKVLGLEIIPVVTKIDLPSSQPEETALTMGSTFSVDPDAVIWTSAKKNIGILEVLEAVVDKLPSPALALKDVDGPFLGRIVDSWFDEHRGVVCLIQAIGGTLRENERITTFASSGESKDVDGKSDFSVQEIGILTPTPLRTNVLKTGQVGYVIAGMRSTRQARIGDTMFVPASWNNIKEVEPLPGYEAAKPMLFASVFPVDTLDLDLLFASVDRLCLNDSSITVSRDQSSSLGAGLRCGFLGFLHMEVFTQRLKDEFNIEIIMTSPSVPYLVEYIDGTSEYISNVGLWPDTIKYNRVLEPMVKVTLISPEPYYGAMMDIVKDRRGIDMETVYLDDGQVLMTTMMPWQEVVCDMNDAVKNMSSGYATFNYEEGDYQKADLIKVDICVNHDSCDPLSFIAHSSKAVAQGRRLVAKLKDVIDRQQFDISLQAKIGNKVVASEKLQAYRKDVLQRSGKTVGGGDISRKKKLLEKQKEGKKRGKLMGKVEISQEAFFAVLSR
jgi:GTP-binding protein LepA